MPVCIFYNRRSYLQEKRKRCFEIEKKEICLSDILEKGWYLNVQVVLFQVEAWIVDPH